MAEQVDAKDLKSFDWIIVSVRLRLDPPKKCGYGIVVCVSAFQADYGVSITPTQSYKWLYLYVV